MGFAELELVPDSGTVDRAAIEAELRALEGAFVDPWDPSCWFVGETKEDGQALLEKRRSTPSTRPYSLLVLIESTRLWFVGEFAGAEEIALLRPMVERLCSAGGWRARDAAYSKVWREPLSFFTA